MVAAMQQPDPDSPRGEEFRISTRVEMEREVRLRFENLDGFITECSTNISATGMFIRCRDPQPKGSVVHFEFSLEDGEKLISGYGEVMWARRHDDGPDRPAGMGLRFLHLDAESRELIRWTVTRRYITGGGPCDLSQIRSEMQRAAAEESAARDYPAARPAGALPGAAPAAGRRDRVRELGLTLLLLAGGLLGGLYLLNESSPTAKAAASAIAERTAPAVAVPRTETAAAVETATEPAPGEATIATTPVAASVETATPEPEAPAETGPQPFELARDWARAWSEQRAEDYLAFYAAGFRPPRGLSRGAWEEQRRVRILRPRRIAVELSGVTAETLSAERARVRFEQAYRSDTYADQVNKTLELVRVDGAWRILEERVES